MRLSFAVVPSLCASILAASVPGLGCASGKVAECPPPPFCETCAPAPKPAGKPLEVPRESLQVDREKRFQVVAFSADGTRALLRAEDEMVGDSFQLVDLVGGAATFATKPIKAWLFQSFIAKPTEKQARRALEPAAPPPISSRTAPGPEGLSLVAADVPDALVVYVMRGERSIPYLRIPRLAAADGTPATIEIRALAWDPTGKRALVIHAQKVPDDPAFESEFLHVLTLDPKRLPFD